MTSKKEMLGQRNRRERKGSPDLIFKRCFLFLIVYILAPLVCSEASSQDVDKKKSQLLIAQSPTTDLGRQLWRDRMTRPKDEKTGEGKDELQQLIKQINAIVFKPQAQTPEPLIVVESVQKTEFNKMSSDIDIPQKQETANPERALSHEQISADTLQILKDLSQHPDQLQNPFELAEMLFNSHCLKEAATCYQQALSRLNKEQTEQTDRFDNKAWLLFQIGNCLRSTDRPEALKMYKRLMAEYPDSPWVDLAKAESKLVEWYLKDKPDALIKKYK